jgi:hypothetical protein
MASEQDMTEAVAFLGDTDESLKSTQELIRFDLIRHLALRAKERYLEAADFLGVEDAMAIRLREAQYFNVCPLEWAYDDIAAAYRFQHANQSQMKLGHSPEEHLEQLKSDWETFFNNEVEKLTEDGQLTRAILESCWFHGTKRGEQAESRLYQLLPSRYYGLEKRAKRLDQECEDRLLQERSGEH